MSTMATGLITFEEFERLPESEYRQELLEGELIEKMPPPDKQHDDTAERFYQRIYVHVASQPEERRRARIGVGYQLSKRTWLVRDVSVTQPNQVAGKYYEGSPQIAIEIISESNTARQMDLKIRKYFEHGAAEVWVIYPETRSLWLYREIGRASCRER